MTDSSLSAVFFSEPRGVLVLRADTPVGQALTLSLAQPNARLALSCQTENSTLWETTAQTLQAGAIALPLEKTGVFDPDSSETLVERVVEDFGRLDLVVFPLVSEGEDRTVLKETIMEEITHLACAARPLLRRARPTGFFLIVSNTPLPTGFSPGTGSRKPLPGNSHRPAGASPRPGAGSSDGSPGDSHKTRNPGPTAREDQGHPRQAKPHRQSLGLERERKGIQSTKINEKVEQDHRMNRIPFKRFRIPLIL